MFTQIDTAVNYINNNNIRMVDLKFCDIYGRWHHVTISAKEFTPNLMTSGVGFDGSSVGLKNVKSGDMALIPDLSTAFLDPFWESPTLSFICNTVEADTKQLFALDPRQIICRAQKYLQSINIASHSMWGPEFEFYIFDNVSFENKTHTANYRIESSEAHWNSSNPGLGYYVHPHGGYHTIPPNDHLFHIRNKIALILEDLGIPIKYHHHEVGGPGQCEIETPMMEMLQAADASMLIKYTARMIAYQSGLSASFLPKPLYAEAGNGMHFHQQLFQQEKNIFYDSEQPYSISQLALYYIGGLLYHAPAVLAFTNPTTNSYRRLVPGFEAPVNCFFSSGNRSAAIRIPKYATLPNQVRFEFRPPDATCNPYLAMAVMLMAGLDGIKKKIDPSQSGFGPFDEDIFSWPKDKIKQIKNLPSSLAEAISALEQDHEFLLDGEVFNQRMIEDWIAAKRREFFEVNARPHPYEIELYYDL